TGGAGRGGRRAMGGPTIAGCGQWATAWTGDSRDDVSFPICREGGMSMRMAATTSLRSVLTQRTQGVTALAAVLPLVLAGLPAEAQSPVAPSPPLPYVALPDWADDWNELWGAALPQGGGGTFASPYRDLDGLADGISAALASVSRKP